MSLRDIVHQIASSEGTLLYFSGPDCGVCQVWKPKVMSKFESEFPEMNLSEVDLSNSPEIAAKFGVFTAPILLVFFESREYFRESKNVNLIELIQKIKRIKQLMEA